MLLSTTVSEGISDIIFEKNLLKYKKSDSNKLFNCHLTVIASTRPTTLAANEQSAIGKAIETICFTNLLSYL